MVHLQYIQDRAMLAMFRKLQDPFHATPMESKEKILPRNSDMARASCVIALIFFVSLFVS